MGLPEPYYSDELTIIYHCDNRSLPRITVDHLITDPPYSADVHALHASGRKAAQRADGGARGQLDFQHTSYEGLLDLFGEVSIRRWAIMTMDEFLTADLRREPPSGWNFVRTGVWVKPGAIPQFSGNKPAMGWEPVAILHREGTKMKWNGGGRDAVWRYTVAHGEHPTEKPVGLYKSFVGLFTDPLDTILDPFMGSGTTLVAAKSMGRRAVGVEISEEYCEIAATRLQSVNAVRVHGTHGRKEADARARGYRGLLDEVVELART